MKKVTKTRCVRCRKRFVPAKRGRRPKYCSASCRQRAYEQRRVERIIARRMPVRLLAGDIDEMRSRSGIERTVVDVLCRLGFLPPALKGPGRLSRLRLVSDEPSGGGDQAG